MNFRAMLPQIKASLLALLCDVIYLGSSAPLQIIGGFSLSYTNGYPVCHGVLISRYISIS